MYTFYKKYEHFFITIFILVPYIVLYFLWDGLYRDTDNYTHAIRVLDLIKSKTWVETVSLHSNYPFGEIPQYTRITDIFWLICSAPFFFFMEAKQAIFYGGILMQPVIAVMTACALYWGIKPFFKPLGRFMGVLIYFIQPAVTIYMFARPDHHTLVSFFAIIITGCFLNLIKRPNHKLVPIAGICSGLALWTSVEGLLFSYFFAAALLLIWLIYDKGLKTAKTFMLYSFGTALICLLINPPYQGLLYPDNGRLSFLSVVILGLTAIALVIEDSRWFKPITETRWKKFFSLLCLAFIFINIAGLIFDYNTLVDPHFPPEIKEIWFSRIAEARSALSTPYLFISHILPAAIAFLLSIYAFWKSDQDQRKALLITSIPLLGFTLLTLISIRFVSNASVFVVFPFMMFWKKWTAAESEQIERFSLPILVVGYVLGCLYLTASWADMQDKISASSKYIYNFGRLAPYLPKEEGSVLADAFRGPEIIWHLERPVIGTPDHRNIQGIVDSHRMLHGTDSKETTRLLKEHKVRFILLHTFSDVNPSEKAAVFNLDCAPTTRIKLPGEIDDKYLIYKITANNCS